MRYHPIREAWSLWPQFAVHDLVVLSFERSRGLPSHEPAVFISWGPTEGNISMRDRSRHASSDHRCDRCGYQIATAAPFPRCPMCGTKDWKRVVRVRQRDSQAALM